MEPKILNGKYSTFFQNKLWIILHVFFFIVYSLNANIFTRNEVLLFIVFVPLFLSNIFFYFLYLFLIFSRADVRVRYSFVYRRSEITRMLGVLWVFVYKKLFCSLQFQEKHVWRFAHFYIAPCFFNCDFLRDIQI